MPPKREFTLSEGISLNLTCRFRKGPKNPITWKKNGVNLNPDDQQQSAQIIETKVLSMLMLTNLTLSDAGNYSCQSLRKSGLLSQWIYIHIKDKYGDVNGSQTVADEPHSKIQGVKRKQSCTDPSSCKPEEPNLAYNQQTSRYNDRFQHLADNDFPIVKTTKPYAFLLDNASELQNTDDYIGNIQLTDNCETFSEGCVDRLGSSTAVIGIGTMCSLFFIAVIVSAFFIRRKILRQQRRVLRLQKRDSKNAEATLSVERLTMETMPPDQDRVPMITSVSQRAGAFQEVIYIDRTSNISDVVYVPHSTVFEQQCSCVTTTLSQPLLVQSVSSSQISQDSTSCIHRAKDMPQSLEVSKWTVRPPD